MFTWGQPANDKTIFFFFSLNFEMKLMLGLLVLNKITGSYRHISLVERITKLLDIILHLLY